MSENPPKQRHILITGAGGFIGRHLVQALQKRGDHVFAIQRQGRTVPEGCIAVPVQDYSPECLAALRFEQPIDCLVHLAAGGLSHDAREENSMRYLNVDCTMALANMAVAKGIPVMVFAGSSAEYADEAIPPFEPSQPTQMIRAYGASKAKATQEIVALSKRTALNAIVLRLYNVYGPGEAKTRLFPSLVEGLNGSEIIALSPGTQIRDFIYVNDVVDAFIKAIDLKEKPTQPIIDVCTGLGTSVRDFAELICSIKKANVDLLGFGLKALNPDDISEVRGCPRNMEKVLGFKARYSLEAGMRDALKD